MKKHDSLVADLHCAKCGSDQAQNVQLIYETETIQFHVSRPSVDKCITVLRDGPKGDYRW